MNQLSPKLPHLPSIPSFHWCCPALSELDFSPDPVNGSWPVSNPHISFWSIYSPLVSSETQNCLAIISLEGKFILKKKKIQDFISSLESPRMLQVWLSRSDSDNFQRTILNWPLVCPNSPHSPTVFCHSRLIAYQFYWGEHMAGYKLPPSSFESAENNTIF